MTSLKTLPLSPDGHFAASSVPLSASDVERMKVAFTARRIDRASFAGLVYGAVAPHAGDLVLARVVKLGEHARLQDPTGRRVSLYVGDEIVVAYGNRYAPDQFEALVPEDLSECHLVASGGIAARALTRRAGVKAPTSIKPLGLLADASGAVLNLQRNRLPVIRGAQKRARVTAVVGTAMNAGKTTCAAHIIKGLVRAGERVAAAKVTGTGAGNDLFMYRDAGACVALDFTDAGHASTFCLAQADVVACFTTLLAHSQDAAAHVVIEVADGLLQRETAALLQSTDYSAWVDTTIFCAGDALGAVAGVDWLEQRGITVAAVSGLLSASPLASAEARRATRLPVYTRDQLAHAETARAICGG